MTEAAEQTRCTYQPRHLRCIRDAHPEDPTAHIRQADPADPHLEAEEPGA